MRQRSLLKDKSDAHLSQQGRCKSEHGKTALQHMVDFIVPTTGLGCMLKLLLASDLHAQSQSDRVRLAMRWSKML